MGELQAAQETRILSRHDLDLLCAGRQSANNRHWSALVRAENGERIAMTPVDERLHRLGADPGEAILANRHERRPPMSRRLMIVAKPRSGIASQFGRLAAS